MSDIDALRQRVEAAERSFGLIDERDRNYSARLINLISGIEEQLRQHQAELAERDARLGRQERENGELRAMLHSLLLAVEDGGKDRLGDTVNSMDQRVSALLAGDGGQSDQSAPPAEPAAAEAETGSDADASTPEMTTDETTAESDQMISAPDEAPEGAPEAAPEPVPTAETASNEMMDLEAADPPPVEGEDADAEAAVATAAENAGDPGTAEDEGFGEELLASLEDEIEDAPAEATGADTEEDPIEIDIGAEAAPDQSEEPLELAEAEDEASTDDTAALDEILSGDQAKDPMVAPEAEQPTVGALEGTDVVMVGGEADDTPDQAAEASDPELAKRAEKIAALLSSGDESDPSVKEIIDKVTELAASLSAESGETAGRVDPTAETLVETSAIPDPAAEAAPQVTSAA